jgi:hypothetical protein
MLDYNYEAYPSLSRQLLIKYPGNISLQDFYFTLAGDKTKQPMYVIPNLWNKIDYSV